MLWLSVAAGPAQAGPQPPTPNQVTRTFLPLTLSSRSALDGPNEMHDDEQSRVYTLKPGDDLAVLAMDMGRNLELMGCITRSGKEPLSELRPGQTVVVPAPDNRCHTVLPGETLAAIAQLHGVTTDVILGTAWNALINPQEPLEPGRRLLIPGGKSPDLAGLRSGAPVATTTLPTPAVPAEGTLAQLGASGSPPAVSNPPLATSNPPSAWPYGDGHFIWPALGRISQGFGPGHRALDIAVPVGTPVRAVDNGVVLESGYSTVGYGGRVIIDHKIDYTTLYAHLAQSLVEPGDIVRKGQIVGFVGSTGNSTGPHLHFELRDFGYLIDPTGLMN